MPQLVIKSGSRAEQTIELLSGVVRLGRNPETGFCFDDATVSSRHCEVIVREDAVRIRDLGSTNGTFIDGQQIKEAVLRPGQILRLGSVEIALEAAPVKIAIPEFGVQQPSPFLPDGARCCFNHSGSHATMECPQCRKTFCELCVHQVSRVGGAALRLCPVCGGHCRPIGQAKVEKKRKSRISSWIGKLTAKMTGRLTRTHLF
jgi:FHA domain